MATTTVGPIFTEQVNKTFYVGFGSLANIQEAVDAAVDSGHPSMVVIPQGYWGTDLISDVVNGTDWVYLTDQRGWNPFYYLWEDNQYRGPFINLSGKINLDTFLDLNGNALTIAGNGTVYIGGTDSSNATMIQDDGSLSAPNLSSPNAEFDVCLVDGSPVRTFENTGDPGTGMTYPPAGLAVSTGEGWGPSIPTNNFVPVAGGTMTGPLTMAGAGQPTIRLNNPNAPANQRISELTTTTFSTQWNFISDDGNTSNFWIGATRDGATPTNITLNGAVWIEGQLNGGSDIRANGTISSYGPQQSTPGGIAWLNGGNIPVLAMTNFSGGQDSQIFRITQNPDATLFENVDGSGNGHYWMQVIRSGADVTAIWFSAPINGPAKNFVIPHPSDDNKLLAHSCVEGPEHAVFYRGEGKTKNGITEIQLPDYFEALTVKQGRTVQVTPLIEEDNEAFSPCAATRVKDGKFRVCSANKSQSFYWEVKATRADIQPLEVIRDRKETQQPTSDKKKARQK